MKLQEKYPETNSFHWHNANPKGKITTDCVLRAISEASGVDYNTIVMNQAEYLCKTGVDPRDGGKGMDGFLKLLGYVKHRQPRKFNNKKYTGKEFCKTFKYYDNIIANIGGNHVVCIKKHQNKLKVWDTWDCTDKCVGNFWVKECIVKKLV